MKKLLAIITALLLVASLCACNNNDEEETTTNNKIEIPGGTDASGSENGDESDESDEETTAAATKVGNPGDYEYTTLATPETVYVRSETKAAHLRDADYNPIVSLNNGTALERIGISTDASGYWSKVVYEGNTCYIASKLLTTFADPDEGFVACEKNAYLTESTTAMAVRDLPSMDEGEVIGHAEKSNDKNDSIKVIAINTEDGWYKVEVYNKDGELKVTGYMAANPKYIEVETDADTSDATTTDAEETTTAVTSN